MFWIFPKKISDADIEFSAQAYQNAKDVACTPLPFYVRREERKSGTQTPQGRSRALATFRTFPARLILGLHEGVNYIRSLSPQYFVGRDARASGKLRCTL